MGLDATRVSGWRVQASGVSVVIEYTLTQLR